MNQAETPLSTRRFEQSDNIPLNLIDHFGVALS